MRLLHGVEYGRTTVFDEDGSFVLTTDGDEPTDETCKFGGIDGDPIVYRLHTDEHIYIANENNIFETGETYEGDLNFFTSVQPNDSIKINEIVIQPEDEGNQYVYIYDDLGIELHRWKLEDHDGYSITLDELEPRYHRELPYLLYVDLGDESIVPYEAGVLMLFWNPGPSGINRGEWIIMDRVEFGHQDKIPHNTTLVDYPGTPGVGEGLVRRESGHDTDNCLEDFIIRQETGRVEEVNLPVPTNVSARWISQEKKIEIS